MLRDALSRFTDRLIPDLIGAPTWVWPAVAIASFLVVLIVWGYVRAPARRNVRLISAGVKLFGVAVLAFCLVEPLNSGLRPRSGANVFAILVDNSQSMRIANPQQSTAQPERLAKLLDAETSWRIRLGQDFDVRRYAFDARLQSLEDLDELAYDGNASGLRGALETLSERFNHHPPAGMLLFADGNATDLADADVDWSQLGYPVFPVIDAADEEIADVAIRNVTINQSNFEASPVTLGVQVETHGFAGREVVARLSDEEGENLQEQTQNAPADGEPVEFRFRYRPETSGVAFHRVDVFLKSERGRFDLGETRAEATIANNSRVVMVDRGGGPFHVLYVSGRPNWEYKFLRRALQEDDEVRLVGLLRVAHKEAKFNFRDREVSSSNPLFRGFDVEEPEDVERYDEAVLVRLGIDDPKELEDGFPSTGEELFAFHAVILDDVEAAFFKADQLQLLREFVASRGGGLLMLGGQESFVEGDYDRTPLGELSPVYLDQPPDDPPVGPFRLDLTREGWLQPWTRVRTTEVAERKRLEEMPEFKTVNATGLIKPGASVLSRVSTSAGQTAPGLVVQRFGKGRSAAMMVGDLWRWAMHRESDEQRDLEQAWRQTVRWLVSDVPRRVEVRTRQDEESAGLVNIEVLVRDSDYKPLDNAKVDLVLTTPAGEKVDLTAEADAAELGLFTAVYRPDEKGGYRVEALARESDGTELDSREGGFAAEPAAKEFESLGLNRQLLEEIARQTGGELVDAGELSQFVTSLPNHKTVVSERWTSPYWHQPWVLAFVILLLCGEWGLRRRNGLP